VWANPSGLRSQPQAVSKVVVSGEAYGFLPDSRHDLFWVGGLTLQVGGLTLQVEGLTLQVEGLTLQVGGLTLQVGGLTPLWRSDPALRGLTPPSRSDPAFEV
jgi:hypothetical protein